MAMGPRYRGSNIGYRMANTRSADSDSSDLQNAARRLLNDIESMATGSDLEFGEFSEWRSTGDEGVVIAWPNLEISAANLREALERSRS